MTLTARRSWVSIIPISRTSTSANQILSKNRFRNYRNSSTVSIKLRRMRRLLIRTMGWCIGIIYDQLASQTTRPISITIWKFPKPIHRKRLFFSHPRTHQVTLITFHRMYRPCQFPKRLNLFNNHHQSSLYVYLLKFLTKKKWLGPN